MSIVAVHGPTMFGSGDLTAAFPAIAAMADLATLQADATYGDGNWTNPPFATGAYVTLDDASKATWDGAAWSEQAAPVTLMAPAPMQSASVTKGQEKFDPADHTVSEVQDYVEAHPDELDAILMAEEAGKNRVTLVDWLIAQAP